MDFWAVIKKNSILLSVTLVAIFTFGYHLGYSSLESFDEAWYGSISRNIAATGNILALSYNGQRFTDHPPLGFMMMAIPQFLFGSNEWTVRIITSILGVLSIALTYLIGRNLFNKKVGYYGAIFLTSSLWFVLRARSGNLDVPFIFFFLLVIFFITKKRLGLAIIATAGLLLVKTLIGFAVLPLLIFVLISKRKDIEPKTFFCSSLLFLVILLPWYIYNYLTVDNFLYDHFLKIGLRSETNQIPQLSQVKTTLLYLQSGIGKWYKPALLSLPLALAAFLLARKFKSPLLMLGIWLVSVATPLFLSSQTEIWHLIPVYPPLLLSLAFGIWLIENLIAKKIPFTHIVIPTLITIIAIVQLKNILTLVAPKHAQLSDEAEISLEAQKHDGTVRLKSWFLPAAVYYTERPVDALGFRQNAEAELEVFASDDKPDLFILELEQIDIISTYSLNYVVQNSSYVLAKDY